MLKQEVLDHGRVADDRSTNDKPECDGGRTAPAWQAFGLPRCAQPAFHLRVRKPRRAQSSTGDGSFAGTARVCYRCPNVGVTGAVEGINEVVASGRNRMNSLMFVSGTGGDEL